MDELPVEMLHQIVSYLSGRDLNPLRLVNRTLSAVASIFKFRALHVRVTRSGLDYLLHVSRQPELARCVREITYPYEHLALMENPRVDFLDSCLDPTAFSQVERFATMFFDWYTDNYVAQMELEDSGECVRTLESALSRMANIRAIVPGHNNFSICFEFEKWCRTLSATDKAYVQGEKQAMKAVMDLVKTTHRLRFMLDRFERGVSGIWGGFLSEDSDLWNCASLFQNLTSVNVCITTLNTSEDTGALMKEAAEGRIYKFLTFAPNLKTLSLAIIKCCNNYLILPGIHRVEVPRINLLDVLGRGYVWKNLHTVNLDLPPIRLEDLVGFLGRHAMTLKCLRLCCGLLPNGTWREVMDFLKERLHLMDLKLDYIRENRRDAGGVRKVYSVDAERKMIDYILRGGAPFPPTSRMECYENGWDTEAYSIEDSEKDNW
ncbi:hypothetical protein RUND412_004736, partial [Rhizina undulata]